MISRAPRFLLYSGNGALLAAIYVAAQKVAARDFYRLWRFGFTEPITVFSVAK